jgi:hypothetical protein
MGADVSIGVFETVEGFGADRTLIGTLRGIGLVALEWLRCLSVDGWCRWSGQIVWSEICRDG